MPITTIAQVRGFTTRVGTVGERAPHAKGLLFSHMGGGPFKKNRALLANWPIVNEHLPQCSKMLSVDTNPIVLQ